MISPPTLGVGSMLLEEAPLGRERNLFPPLGGVGLCLWGHGKRVPPHAITLLSSSM